MLKRPINSINNVMVEGDTPSRSLHCWTEKVPDQAAITTCISNANIKIEGIKRTIYESKKQLKVYEDLKLSIDEKINEATTLQGNFGVASTLVQNANLNIDFQGCDNCITNLISTYGDMQKDCDDKIEEWTNKLDELDKSLEEAESDKAKCSDLTKTITVCSR